MAHSTQSNVLAAYLRLVRHFPVRHFPLLQIPVLQIQLSLIGLSDEVLLAVRVREWEREGMGLTNGNGRESYYKNRNVVGGTNGDRGGLSACGLTDEIGVAKA